MERKKKYLRAPGKWSVKRGEEKRRIEGRRED